MKPYFLLIITFLLVIHSVAQKGRSTVSRSKKNYFLRADTMHVLATRYITVEKDVITNAIHNEKGWMFWSKDRTYTPETAAKRVQLSLIIKLDKSILELSKMPNGYYAHRISKKSPWVIEKVKDRD